MLQCAWDVDAEIFDFAISQNVSIATPTTLIPILHNAQICWQQHNTAEDAQQILEMSKELYERTAVFTNHLGNVSSGLKTANDSFNAAVKSYNRNMVSQTKKLQALDRGLDAKKTVEPVALLEADPTGFALKESPWKPVAETESKTTDEHPPMPRASV